MADGKIVSYVSVADFRKSLSKYLEAVENGELVVVKRHKKNICILKIYSDDEIGQDSEEE